MGHIEHTTCYQCDAEATGREHTPPRCLFPKGEDWPGLITVPSCVLHNNATSTADEYLKFLLGAIGRNTPSAITSGTARSIVRLALKGSSTLHRYGFSRDRDALVIDNDFPLDFELLSKCLDKMARALYFHHNSGSRKLLGTLKVWPLFIPVDPGIAPELASLVTSVKDLIAQDFKEYSKEGEHQEIFAYQVIEANGSVVVNMEFYGAYRAVVMAAGMHADS